MADGRTLQDFLDFLLSLGEKGMIPQNTATGRRAAAQKVFAILTEAESLDMTQVDIDDVMMRFANLNRSKYTRESLRSYQSRLRNSLVEFSDYCENPLAFRPRRRVKAIPIKRLKVDAQNGSSDDLQLEDRQPPHSEPVSHRPVVQVFPIALRPDLTIQIAGLPFDLTTAEAKKIANIILAHATET